jgi:hypothetical protein
VWLVRRIDTSRFYKAIYGLLMMAGLDLIYVGGRATLGL